MALGHISPSFTSGFARSASQSRRPRLWKGLVAAWAPCIGPTGLTIKDYGPKRMHGSLESFTAIDDWVRSDGEWSLNFDATNNHIRIPLAAPMTAAFDGPYTLLFWVKTTSTSLLRTFRFSTAATGYHIVLFNYPSAGKIKFYSGLGTDGDALDSTTATLNDGTWRFIALTVANGTSSATMKIYVDGKQDSTRSRSALDTASTSDIVIGAKDPASDQYFDGLMGEWLLYDREMSANEIGTFETHRGMMFEKKRTRVRKAQVAATRRYGVIGGGVHYSGV